MEIPFRYGMPDWTFQDKIPTIYSEYEVSMIPFYEYVYRIQGIKFDYQNSVIAEKKRILGKFKEHDTQYTGNDLEFQDYVHTYVLKDIPAFKNVLSIAPDKSEIIKMVFELARYYTPTGDTMNIISTWPELNRALLKHRKFGKHLEKSSMTAKKILEKKLDLSGLDPNSKAKVIIEFVKSNFKWNGINGKYAALPASEFARRKKGNVADINLMMMAMLNEANIDTKPVV